MENQKHENHNRMYDKKLRKTKGMKKLIFLSDISRTNMANHSKQRQRVTMLEDEYDQVSV